jgi:phosphoribosyl 1,2-cyclic phosphodiesterase
MTTNFRLSLKFWGVRGSIPTPIKENMRYGGNTLCIEVRLPSDEILVFDGGTGIRGLGDFHMDENENKGLNVRVFLTHFHWDHIQGIPFFRPLYAPDNRVIFHTPRISHLRKEDTGADGGAEGILSGQFSNPYFPVSFEFLLAKKEFVELDLQPTKFGDLTISPFLLNHLGGAFGYRIESEGAVIVYATDLEHGDKELDKTVREYSQNADLLIFDSQYTPEDYEAHKGWGHSTWQEACKVANECQVKQLVLFHHKPSYDDAKLDQIAEEASREFENVSCAREGDSVIL